MTEDKLEENEGGPRSFNKVPCWLIVWRKNRNAKVICTSLYRVHKGVLQEEEATKGTSTDPILYVQSVVDKVVVL